MLHDLLDSLWMIDEGGGRMYSDLLLASTRAMVAGHVVAGLPGQPPIALPAIGDSREQLAALYGLEAEGLKLVDGPHTVPRGVQAAAGVGGQAQLGAIVVIPVFGLVQQHRSWMTEYGVATSTDFVMRAVQACVADPQVGGVVLRFHSPGGTVYGVKVLADYLLKARKEKPIWGHADSQSCSAAYWLLACCERAIGTPMADVGSVGCFMVHTSYQDADKQLGIKRTVIRAGKNKADANEHEDLSEEARARLQARADAAFQEFSAGVGKGRGISAEKVKGGFGEGSIVMAQSALAEGMLDDVASFQDTLVAMAKLVRANARSSSTRAQADVDLQLLQQRSELGLLGKA